MKEEMKNKLMVFWSGFGTAGLFLGILILIRD
jgi:hypothetical protein